MFEVKVTIVAPEIVGAINKLSDAITASVEHKAAEAPAVEAKPAQTAPAPAVEAKPLPVAPAPEPDPVPVAPMPAPAPAPAPVASMPAPAPAPAPVAPAPAVEAKPIDLHSISRAGAGLIDKGKMPQIMELLKKYGVQAVTQLKPEQFSDFANDLRALGAEI